MIEQLFRRRFWVLHVIFLTIAACILAACVGSIIVYFLRGLLPDDQRVSASTSFSPAVTNRDFAVANERNLFGARREIVENVKPGVVQKEVAKDNNRSLGQWQDAVASQLPVKLVGTAVFANPHFSLASIVPNAKQGKVSLYSVNLCHKDDPFPCNRLLEFGEIVRIEASRVYLYNEKEHRYEYLKIDMASQLARRTATAPSQVASGKSAAGQNGEIRQVTEGSYEIDQSHLDGVLNDLAKVAMDARAVPYLEGGKQVGFKVFSIRAGSVFEKIGLKNGDILVSVNGNRLNNLSVAMGLLDQLRRKKHFTIDLKRAGASRTLDYAVK